MIFFIMMADHSKHPEVNILQWFGLKIDLEAIKFTIYAIGLNSVLFMGEIY